MTDRPDLEPLVFAALDHAIDSLRHAGGPLTPFVMRAEGKRVELHRFAAETLEAGQEHAREFMRDVPPATTAVALAYDGYLTVDGVRRDALFVAVQAAGTSRSDLYAQQYEIRGPSIAAIGNPKHVAVDEPPLLPGPAAAKSGILGRLHRRR